MLDALPDNKIVEDIHNAVRHDCKQAKQRKRCTARLQDVATATKVLEQRDISHAARVTKEDFIQCFQGTKPASTVMRHYAARHPLPKSLTQVMGRKVWATVNESWSRKGIAAWVWLQEGYGRPCTRAGRGEVKYDSAFFSRLVGAETLLLNLHSGRVVAFIGTRIVGGLTLARGGAGHRWARDAHHAP